MEKIYLTIVYINSIFNSVVEVGVRMSDIREIRNKLGVSNLDKSTREKLLEDFKKAGGVVIDDQPQSFVFDKDKQKEWLEKTNHYYEKNGTKKERNDALWKYESLDIWTYLSALFHGVISFSGKYVRKGFFLFFQKKILPVFRHCAVIISNIFQIDLDYDRKIEYEIRKQDENGFDVLEKFRDLYSDSLFVEFLQPEVLHRRVYVKSKLLLAQVSELLKQIYILKPYENIIRSSLKTALEYEDILLKVKNAPALMLALEQEITFVFHKFFNKLFLLFEIMTEHKYDLESEDLDEVLNISPTDRVGYYVEKIKEKTEQENNETESDEPPSEPNANIEHDEEVGKIEQYSDEEAKRIQVLANIPYNEWVVLFSQKKGVFINFHDKAFVLYVMMMEFAEEYSFVLSTTKIKINMVYSNSAKIDYRNMLNNLYVKLDDILDSFKSYFEIIKDMRHAHELDEIEMFNRMQVLNEKKQKVFSTISMDIFHFFQTISDIMEDFFKNLEDDSQNRKIIENPEDTISFDISIEGNKKLNHYKIIDILKSVHLFAEAILYELDDTGVLAGHEPELQVDYLDTIRKRQKSLNQKLESEQQQDEKKSDFIVDELEEILK